ncbi:MAG: hypothetical protein QOE07_2039 [Acidimicrobiaceae bacterium]|nr:hypothetical protein [Acidimicrobiaceae bacterium]
MVLAPTAALADPVVTGSGAPAASDADVVHRGGAPGEVITAAKDFNGPIRRGCGPEWDVTNGKWGLVPNLPGAAAANGAGLTALLAEVGPGDHVVFPSGEMFVPASTIANNQAARCLTFEGKGKLSSWLTPVGDFAGALLELSPSGPPPNGARGAYGGGVTSLGLNLAYAPSCRGIHLGPWAGWAELRDLWIQGGAISIWNEGPNNWMEDLRLFDAGQFFAINANTGLELTIRDVQTARHGAGTTTRVLCVTSSLSAASGGALYIHDFRHTSGTTNGVQTNAGFLITSSGNPNLSIPTFASKVVLDNLTGGGPGLELNGVRDQHFDGGWINCGAASGGPCVRITGGGNLRFSNNDFFGGGSGTGVYKTYDFVGGTTTGFVSTANTCATNWVYHLPSTGGPRTMICDDLVPGAVAGMAVSNDMAQFLAATNAPRFGSHRFSDKTVLDRPVLPDGKASGFATLKRGTVTIPTSLADTALSVIHKGYRTLSGTPGVLVDGGIVTGASFTINSLTATGALNTADNSTIEWILVARG